MACADAGLRRALRRVAWLGLCTAVLAWPAMAQTTVYRCGHDGRSYSQHPCAEGRAVDVADRRTPGERAEGDVATLRSRRALEESMRRSRLEVPGPRMAGAMRVPASTASERADVQRARDARSASRTLSSSKASPSSQAFEAVAPAKRSTARKR